MIEKGVPKPPDADKWIDLKGGIALLSEAAYRWIVRVYNSYPKVQTFELAVTPTAVTASTESVQTFTLTGATTMDIVVVNKPTNQSGLDLVHAWISADDTLSVKYRNQTGGDITPTAETYRIFTMRL